MVGGARSRSGPPPDPNSRTQTRRQGDWVILPDSYSGPVPDWPLDRDYTLPVKDEDGFINRLPIHDEELRHWERLWCKGQGREWRRQHQEDRVARLCRVLAISDVQLDVTKSSWLGEIRQLEEDLGLSQSGMARLKWRYNPRTEDQDAPIEEETGPAGRRGQVFNLMDRLEVTE